SRRRRALRRHRSARPRRPPVNDAWRRLLRHRMAVACGIAFGLIAAFCYLGPIIAGWFGVDAIAIDTQLGASPPSFQHWFGTDTLGRDMLVRVMIGGRLALEVALITTSIALLIGVTWGASAAYAGGRIDNLMMRIVDAMYGFPTIVFVIVVMAVF